MTLDFTNDTGTLYFYGVLPTYSVYAMSLTGRYSNDDLLFEKLVTPRNKIQLTAPTQFGTAYYALRWDITGTDITDKDVAGYYILKVWGGTSVINSTNLIETVLCKVKVDDAITDTVFTSDAENNEQVIYFR